MDGSDLTAAAYGRKPPRYPVLPATVGVAITLLLNRSTVAHQGLWLVQPTVGDVVCDCAEAFAEAAMGVGPPAAWRAGALSSLRTLAGEALHVDVQPWPVGVREDSDGRPVRRLWLDVGPIDPMAPRPTTLPPWMVANARGVMAGANLAAGWDALETRYEYHRGILCAFDTCWERPADSRRLRRLVTGDDESFEDAQVRWSAQRAVADRQRNRVRATW